MVPNQHTKNHFYCEDGADDDWIDESTAAEEVELYFSIGTHSLRQVAPQLRPIVIATQL